jgi:O-antigen ligase
MRFSQKDLICSIALLLSCGLIAILEAATRQPYQWVDIEALTYAPTPYVYPFTLTAALVFFIYWLVGGTRFTNALLSFWVFSTVVYSKDFAYVHLDFGIPIFVTEIVLGITLLGLLLRVSRGRKIPSTPLNFPILLFLLLGTFHFMNNVFANGLLAARDYAMTYYSLFYFVVLCYFAEIENVEKFFLFFFVGSVIATLSGLAYFLHLPEERRYIFYGAFVLFCFLFVVNVIRFGILRNKMHTYFSLLVLLIGVTLYNARNVYVALLVSTAFGLLIQRKILSGQRLLRGRRTLRMLLLAAVVLVGFYLLSPTFRLFIDTSYRQFISGTIDYTEDLNARFRFAAWAEAYSRFTENPVLGEGFGIPFTFEGVEIDARPHNTFLTVLYKMGLVGFLLFLLILFIFFKGAITKCRTVKDIKIRAYVYSLLIVQFCMCVTGMFGLLLETPFAGAMFWINMGLVESLLAANSGMSNPLHVKNKERANYNLTFHLR